MTIWMVLTAVVVIAVVAVAVWRYLATTRLRTGAPAPSVSALPTYNPQNIGNDAAARPWENFPASFNSCPVPGTQQDNTLPFDKNTFLQQAKQEFVRLQEAWDNANIAHLTRMMTEDMLAEIQPRLTEHAQRGPSEQKTEILMLQARLLGTEETENQFIVSVEFSGTTREMGAANLMPFREIWDMSKSKTAPNAHWMVAGVESLQ